MENYEFINLRQRPVIKYQAAKWYHDKWNYPVDSYLKCIEDYISGNSELAWYLCLDGEKIIGGLGLIKNDFHKREDLSPNICAVYTEKIIEIRKLLALY